jgi:protein TonB
VFSDDDYPWAAMKKNQSGAITVAVLVDEKGKVSDCTVIETSGVASLDAQSCAIITSRARLRPAVGLDGKPAKGAFVQKIRWEID